MDRPCRPVPNPNDLDHLASIDFSTLGYVTDGHRRRAAAILRCRTDRLPFTEPTNWSTVETLIHHAFDPATTHLDVLPDDVRPRLADASRLSESLRLYDSSSHTELDSWTKPFEVPFFDGIPESSLVTASVPVTHHSERRRGTHDRSKVLVPSTDEDDRDDALRCGEVLSAVLLECTLAGLATCTLTHLTELPLKRSLVGALTGRTSAPQLLIRVGEAPALADAPPMTPRRPLHEVTQAAD